MNGVFPKQHQDYIPSYQNAMKEEKQRNKKRKNNKGKRK